MLCIEVWNVNKVHKYLWKYRAHIKKMNTNTLWHKYIINNSCKHVKELDARETKVKSKYMWIYSKYDCSGLANDG